MPRLIVVPVRIRETDYGALRVAWVRVPGLFDSIIMRRPDGRCDRWEPYVYGMARR